METIIHKGQISKAKAMIDFLSSAFLHSVDQHSFAWGDRETPRKNLQKIGGAEEAAGL